MALISSLLSRRSLGGPEASQGPAGPCAPEIPEVLREFKIEILAGLAAAERRKAELGQAWGYTTARTRSAIIENLVTAAANKVSDDTGSYRPDEVYIKLWPLLAIASWKHNKSGAYRAWQLAKSLDVSGRGAIQEADLQGLAREQGIPVRTWRRWMADAKRDLLICPLARAGWIRLASYHIAAATLGCDNVGVRPVRIGLGRFLSPGWRAHVWGGYEETHGQEPISRRKQKELAGVAVSTQRAYDKSAGVIRRSNISISDRSPDQLEGLKEFETRAAPFEFYDRRKHKFVIAWHLPDSRISRTAASLQRGRSRKINKAIKRNDGSFILERAPSCSVGDMPVLRLFHNSTKQAKQTMRKLSRSDQAPPNEVYLRAPGGKQAQFWQPLTYAPTGGDPNCA
jgi:hypothetical protein